MWTSDGTTGGTHEVHQIYPIRFAELDGRLLINRSVSSELWQRVIRFRRLPEVQ